MGQQPGKGQAPSPPPPPSGWELLSKRVTRMVIACHTKPWAARLETLGFFGVFGAWRWWQKVNYEDMVPHGAIGDWFRAKTPEGSFTWALFVVVVLFNSAISAAAQAHIKAEREKAKRAEKEAAARKRQQTREGRALPHGAPYPVHRTEQGYDPYDHDPYAPQHGPHGGPWRR